MADYRQIHTKIWNDEWFLDQDPDAKLLFIYLFSNPRACLAGIYDIPLKVIIFDTGLSPDRVRELLDKFSADGKARFENGWIFIFNLMRYNANNLQSDKVITNIKNTLDLVPDINLKRVWVSMYGAQIGYTYPINTHLHEHEHEHEQEQEQEKNKEDGANAPATLSPSSFPEWLKLLKTEKNKAGALGRMYAILYNQEPTKEDYGRIAALAKKAGSISALATILWNNASRSLAIPLDYITKIINNNNGRNSSNGKAAPSNLKPPDSLSEDDWIAIQYIYYNHDADAQDYRAALEAKGVNVNEWLSTIS